MATTFPNSPAENELWSADGRVYYLYKSPAWRQVYGQRPIRNRIINSHMQISQQNGDVAGSAGGYYAVDQWLLAVAGAGAVTFGRGGGAGGYSADITVTTATATPGYAIFYHNIEGRWISDFQWGTANARQIVLSFYFFSNISGQFCVTVRNSDYTRSYTQPFTVTPAQASQWIRRTIVVPGDTTGTWAVDSTPGLNIMIPVAANSFTAPGVWTAGNFLAATGQVNGMGTVGNVFRISEVSLHLDINGRGIPQRPDIPGRFDSYRACQRYIEKLGITTPGGLPVEPLMAWGYKTMKRANPSSYSIIQGAPTGAVFMAIAHDPLWGMRGNPQATSAVDHVVLINSRM